jgi:putative ABC transport system permease protein
MIPLKYSVRNLRVRWVTTLMTVLSTGLVVWSSCILFGLVEGLQHSLNVSGEPLDLIILRKGSTNETNGGFEERKADDIATLSGIGHDESGMPLVAKEMVFIPIAERREGTRTNVILRGVSAASPKLRPDFRILPGGRYLEPGKNECVVSRGLAGRFKNSTVGSQFPVSERESYRVVGVFTASGSAAESEIWVDFGDLTRGVNRQGYVSSVQLRAKSPQDRDAMMKKLNEDTQFKLAARTETDYFAEESRTGLLFKVGGTLIAILLTFGAMFAAANTMFAAVKSRTREIGTMRAMGFSRFSILFSFLAESLILCLLGGLLGLLATIPLSAITYSTTSNFAAIAVSFRFGPLVMAVAVTMTLAMGLFGGLFPALRAVRLDVVRALREV